jgi:hypothetical protein
VNENDLLRCIQTRAARIAVGPSAVRRQGEGVAATARGFFETLPLAPLGLPERRASFQVDLDRITDELRLALPSSAQSWGLARKLVNIFLRDCTYTFHLRQAHGLDSVEPLLEVPLDSVTAKALQKGGGGGLPRWLGVKHLTPSVSAQYQRVAQERAAEMGIARVHLDAYWWAFERSGGAAQQGDEADEP